MHMVSGIKGICFGYQHTSWVNKILLVSQSISRDTDLLTVDRLMIEPPLLNG